MKRILLFILLICIIGKLCSCSKTDSDEEYYGPSISKVNQEAVRIQEVALDAFKNRDTTKLENEFSDYVKEHTGEFAKEKTNLNDEIKNAFEFIEGNITTVESSSAGYGGGSTDEQGWVELIYDVHLYKVRTDKYKTYEIHIYGVFFDRKNEQKQGIDHIVIYDNDIIDEDRCGIGNYRKW